MLAKKKPLARRRCCEAAVGSTSTMDLLKDFQLSAYYYELVLLVTNLAASLRTGIRPRADAESESALPPPVDPMDSTLVSRDAATRGPSDQLLQDSGALLGASDPSR
jgi:hypothetical protein